MMDVNELVQDAMPFLSWVVEWRYSLSTLELAEVAQDPDSVAVLSVDVINGFCYDGPLSSPRVASIVAPIARLFERAHELRVRRFVLVQDAHQDDAVEFDSFVAHCTGNSTESETVPEIKTLPFFDQMQVIPKNSISSNLGTDLPHWLDANNAVNTFIVVGDCTDLCTYQLAMYLRLRANALQRRTDRIILPVDCVDTYDLTVPVSQQLNTFPHHGDLLHLVFLYSMALNGVQVVASVI